MMNFFFFVCAYLVLASLIFYFYNLGHILTKKVFFEKTSISINIILGFGIFISFINLIYLTEFGNFKYLLLFLLIHILFLFSKNLKYKFNFKFYCLIILSIIFSLAVFNHQYSNHDDVNGYFNIYSNIINDNYKLSPDSNIRSFYSSLGYNFTQSIFIFLGGYTATYFFDQSFGCILILIFFYEKTQKKLSNIELIFFLVFLALSCLTLSETSMPKVILFSLSLILLDQLKKFFKGPDNLLIILALFLIAYNLRFNFLISFVCFTFIFLFFYKIYENFIFIKKNIKEIFLVIIIFLIPEILQKLYVFNTLSPIFGSKYYITNNFFFKEIIFDELSKNNFLFFWFKAFFKKHLIFILLLLSLFFLIKKNIIFYLTLLLSYFFSIIIYSYIQFPDYANPIRYLYPLENSLIVFLLINIWNYVYILNKKKNYIQLKYFYFFIFALISINLSLSSFNIIFLKKLYLDRLESVNNIFYPKQIINKPFFYKEKIFSQNQNHNYIKSLDDCLKNKKFKKNVLVLIKHAYLVKYKNTQFVDYKYGFTLSKKNYPIFQSYNYKSKYFNENYDQILIEKELLFDDYEIEKYIRDYEKIKKNNLFILKDFYTFYSKYDLYPVIAWLDFARFLTKLVLVNKDSITCNNNHFILLKF